MSAERTTPIRRQSSAPVAKHTANISSRETQVVSIVRQNLLERPGYTPYCGADFCSWRWPRTHFIQGQFECKCSWRSSFEPEFIAEYVKRNSKTEASALLD